MKRSMAIDYIRAMAVVYIVGFWHLFNFTDAFPAYNNIVTYRLTFLLLGLFVFISGFIIGRKESFSNIQSVFTYYRKKVFRVYPLYFLAVTVFFLLGIGGINDLYMYSKVIFFVSEFVRPAPLTLWFISMTMIFYLISPVLIKFSKDLRLYSCICVTFMAVLTAYAFIFRQMDMRLVLYFPIFALAIFVAVHESNIPVNFMAILGAFSIGVAFSFLPAKSWTINQLINMPMIFFGVLLIHYFLKSIDAYLPDKKIIEILSYASFSMYLFHRPIYTVMKSIYFPEQGLWQVGYLIALCFPLVVAVSWGIQKAYDMAFDKLTKK